MQPKGKLIVINTTGQTIHDRHFASFCMQAETLKTMDQIDPILDGTSSGADQREVFEGRFEGELERLGSTGRTIDFWQEENLLSALGAAAVEEFELACAFIDANRRPPSHRPPRPVRRPPMSTATLRWRFKRLRAVS